MSDNIQTNIEHEKQCRPRKSDEYILDKLQQEQQLNIYFLFLSRLFNIMCISCKKINISCRRHPQGEFLFYTVLTGKRRNIAGNFYVAGTMVL